MKILVYGLNFSPEIIGIGRFTGELAEYLEKRHCIVRVITSPPYYPSWRIDRRYSSWRYKVEVFDNTKIFRCPIWVPDKVTPISRLLHLVSFAISSFPVAVAQILWKADLILCIVPTIFYAPTALLVAKLGSSRSWLHVQDFELDTAFNLGLLQVSGIIYNTASAFERHVLAYFDNVSTISKQMVSLVVKKGVTKSRVTYFPNWVDTEKIYPISNPNPMRKTMRISREKIVVLYHGNMGRKQGLEILIEAANLLRLEKRILFVLSGEGPVRQELRHKAKGLPNVLFCELQPASKLNQLVNLADIHVLPQRIGATDLVMPSKLTTMLASGKPIIACAISGSELFEIAKKTGLVVSPGSSAELSRAITYLAQSSSERSRYGRMGRAYAVANFKKEVVLDRFFAEIKKGGSSKP